MGRSRRSGRQRQLRRLVRAHHRVQQFDPRVFETRAIRPPAPGPPPVLPCPPPARNPPALTPSAPPQPLRLASPKGQGPPALPPPPPYRKAPALQHPPPIPEACTQRVWRPRLPVTPLARAPLAAVSAPPPPPCPTRLAMPRAPAARPRVIVVEPLRRRIKIVLPRVDAPRIQRSMPEL
ncbi:PREDICTED: proline-rich receptor-like protein kinase PERK2 [Vollenhovia emeryi]|uniref:proline-rich receptor-like protein kinase PERK2 n=1 Tax=Vollenhovia emeryi TaxID=411798 RepID=UPI0005F48B7D|nr:PREDICTED: proline-rich receptor-like protein kinase PERK2 [Vollenhovia emeryi]